MIFGLQQCSFNQKMCGGFWIMVLMFWETPQPKTHIFWKRVCHRIVKQISNFAWRHEVGPLNLFFYETSWLGVEKTKTIQMIWQNTKHKCVNQIQKLVQYSSFLLAFYEHIFYVSSRYKETIRLYEVKEIWSVIGKILLHIGKNLSEVRR